MKFRAWINSKGTPTISDISERSGFHRSYVWKVATGKRPPSRAFIQRMVAISGGKLKPNDFFPEVSAPAPRRRKSKEAA